MEKEEEEERQDGRLMRLSTSMKKVERIERGSY